MPIDMIPLYDRLRLRHSNPITVTLTRPQSLSAGPEESVTVRYVQKQMASDETVDTPMGGVLSGTRATFNLWLVECVGLVPGEGFLIVEESGQDDPDGAPPTTWVIRSVESCAKGRRFRCKTQVREV